jgi:hypothetical protein
MQINANNRMGPVGPIAGQRPVTAQKPVSEASQVELRQSEAVNQALQATPDVRQDKVERARELIVNRDYPPETILRGIANLLAVKGVPEQED